MSASLIDVLSGVQEYQQWGYNALTFGFLCTVVLTLALQLPSELAQLKTLWSATSADGVDTTLIVTMTGYFGIFLIYGADVGSGGLLFNSLMLGPWFFIILWRLWRIRGFTFGEWLVLCLWMLAVVADVILPWKAYFYMGASIVAFSGPLKQIKTMKEKGTSAGFNPRFALMWGIVCVFWIFYGLALKDLFIAGTALVFGALYVQTYRLAVRLDPCRIKC